VIVICGSVLIRRNGSVVLIPWMVRWLVSHQWFRDQASMYRLGGGVGLQLKGRVHAIFSGILMFVQILIRFVGRNSAALI
jgi:hypothetical protein